MKRQTLQLARAMAILLLSSACHLTTRENSTSIPSDGVDPTGVDQFVHKNPCSGIPGTIPQPPGFPLGPDRRLTTGSLCTKPDKYRYKEQVAYCDRKNLEDRVKGFVAFEYDRLGYDVGDVDRGDYKIDHLVPLCVGGSNEENNLWPQHKSVFAFTDPIEPRLCLLMERGVMQQREAVDLIRRVKTDLKSAAAICAELDRRIDASD